MILIIYFWHHIWQQLRSGSCVAAVLVAGVALAAGVALTVQRLTGLAAVHLASDNQLLGTSFQKPRRAFCGETRPGFGVHWCVYTNGHRSPCGLRDARKGIGVQ